MDRKVLIPPWGFWFPTYKMKLNYNKWSAFMYEKELWATTFYKRRHKIKERWRERGAKRRWNLVPFEVGLTKLKRKGENVKWCVWFLKMIGVLHHALSRDGKTWGEQNNHLLLFSHTVLSFLALLLSHSTIYVIYDCIHQNWTTFMILLDDPILCPAS